MLLGKSVQSNSSADSPLDSAAHLRQGSVSGNRNLGTVNRLVISISLPVISGTSWCKKKNSVKQHVGLLVHFMDSLDLFNTYSIEYLKVRGYAGFSSEF